MDTTEEYVKMCDWSGIQDDWNPSEGDYFQHQTGLYAGTLVIIGTICGDAASDDDGHCCLVDEDFCKSVGIWLPRPDQSIDMLPGGAVEMDVFRTDLGEWQIQGADHYSTGYHKSFEQALLAFVMHTLHQLEWNGEWIKEEV